MLNWIAPTTKFGAPRNWYELNSRNGEAVEKSKSMASEYGDNGGMMASTAVHMMAVQEKIIDEIHEIEVQTLMCAGTEDKVCSTQGIPYINTFSQKCFSNRTCSQSNAK